MSNSALDFFFNNAGRFELLEHEETCKLAKIVQAWQSDPEGCDNLTRIKGKAARDKMVRHNLRLVIHIWRKNYSTRLPHNHPGLLDALQQASIDLVRAAEKYEPSKSKFSTYAAVWIHKGIKQYIFGDDRLIRIPANNVHIIKAAQRLICEARRAGLPQPTSEQMVEELSRTRKHVPTPKILAELIKAERAPDAMSADQSVSNDNGKSTLLDLIRDENGGDTQLVEVREAMKFLNDQEREIINSRYFVTKMENLIPLAKRMGMPTRKCSEMEKSALQSIRNLVAVN